MSAGVQKWLRPKISAVRGVLNDSRVRKVISTAIFMHTAVSPAIEKPSIYAFTRAGVHLLDEIAKWVEIDPENHFPGSEWVNPFGSEFAEVIVRALATYPRKVIMTNKVSTHLIEVDLEGHTVAWFSNQFTRTTDVWVKIEDHAPAREAIQRALWRMYENKSIVLKRFKERNYLRDTSWVTTFEVDDDVKPEQSLRAHELAEFIKRAIAGGKTRSMLLWGPPGSGKTCLARAVLDELGFRSLRLRVEDMSNIDNSTVFDAIKAFAPDAIVVDDLDRIQNGHNKLFEMLSHLKGHVKVVFGTANNKIKIPAPLRRPGRFDMRIKIDEIDEAVVRRVLGPANEHLYPQVKTWPIVYVQELANQLDFLYPSEIKSIMKELRECMKELEADSSGRKQLQPKYDDEDDSDLDVGEALPWSGDDDDE